MAEVEANLSKGTPVTFNEIIRGLGGFGFYGAVGVIAEPYVKNATPLQYEKIADFFAKANLAFDKLYLHDQLTDFCWAAGSFFVTNVFVKSAISGLPEAGVVGISREKLMGNANLITLIGLELLSLGREAVDAAITRSGIDMRDMVLVYTAGFAAAIVTDYLWRRTAKDQKVIEFDLGA